MGDLGALVPLSVLTFGPKTGFLKREIWLMGLWWGRRVGHGLPNGLGGPPTPSTPPRPNSRALNLSHQMSMDNFHLRIAPLRERANECAQPGIHNYPCNVQRQESTLTRTCWQWSLAGTTRHKHRVYRNLANTAPRGAKWHATWSGRHCKVRSGATGRMAWHTWHGARAA